MIDRNSMTDRRILLEAETLRDLGVEVEIVGLGPIADTDSIEGVKRTAIWSDGQYEGSSIQDEEFGANSLTPNIDRFLRSHTTMRPLMTAVAMARFPREGMRLARESETIPAPLRPVASVVTGALARTVAAARTFRSGIRVASMWAAGRAADVVQPVRAKMQERETPTSGARALSSQEQITRRVRITGTPDRWERAVADHVARVRPDVIHVHDLTALKAGCIAKALTGSLLVYDAHELYSHQPGIPKLTRRALSRLESTLMPVVDSAVVINEDQAEVMRSEYGEFDYVCLTNATRAPEGFNPDGPHDLIRSRFAIPPDEPIILFQGGINRGRKIHLLFEGVAQARSRIHLVLLTWGIEIPEFQQLAKDLGIEERIHFVEPVPWNDVVYWAASADAGFMPYQGHDLNTRLSHPNKMYEFITAGTPMIGSSDLVNVRRTLEATGIGVLHLLREGKDYADALDIMFDDDWARWKECKANVLRSREQFSWETLSRDFVGLYERLGVV